jgi:hypothetical protein
MSRTGTVFLTIVLVLLTLATAASIGFGVWAFKNPMIHDCIEHELCEIICGHECENGEQGERGADGLSAYEIAVLNGFEGTETEWLASLKGGDGTDGQDGADGQANIIAGVYQTGGMSQIYVYQILWDFNVFDFDVTDGVTGVLTVQLLDYSFDYGSGVDQAYLYYMGNNQSYKLEIFILGGDIKYVVTYGIGSDSSNWVNAGDIKIFTTPGNDDSFYILGNSTAPLYVTWSF